MEKRAKIGRASLRVFWQMGVILFTGIMLGLVVNQIRPDRLPLIADWSPEAMLTTAPGESMVISLEEARGLCSDKKALFLDARSPEDYARGHIQCALNVPWQAFDEHVDHLLDKITDNAWIVTYCDGEHCSLSEDLAKELVSMGFKNVRVLVNGWTRWVEAGLPIERT